MELGGGSWRHVKRQGNRAAHVMAHCEMSWDSPVVWIDSPPNFLVNQLILDNVTISSG
ncbi:unnamed protein product [Linum tenue]|uniref:RNase H type-1 domain-containing protein n=1 Tax=Linum tenue TaxID=586396 RepID=A0AAV0QRK2_9ROSI|nr:unnamed protein product [Linum tenue]